MRCPIGLGVCRATCKHSMPCVCVEEEGGRGKGEGGGVVCVDENLC